MDENDAISLVREFIANRVKIDRCEKLPVAPYDIKTPQDSYIFRISMQQLPHVGACDYVAVSKTDGKVTYLGKMGE